jgi:hypothetical protein
MIGVDKMDNILTPGEANKSVTYGDLITILSSIVKNIGEESVKYSDTLQDNTFKIIDKLTDSLVGVRDIASYERQRDIRFVLGYLARLWGCSKDMMYDNYQSWCDEFDKLNKPQKNEDKKDE